MGTKHPDLFAALAAPFELEEVKARTQASRQLHYVTARTVMNRLDNVVGPENWWDEYVPGEHSVLCRLTLRLPDGQVLTKADAGGFPGCEDTGDDEKGGYSDAFKRAAVKFGVGRYLYRDGVPCYSSVEREPVPESAAAVEAPAAEAPALTLVNTQPSEAPKAPPAASTPEPQQVPAAAAKTAPRSGKARHDWPGASNPGIAPPPKPEPAPTLPGCPRTGRGLFAWATEVERAEKIGMIKYLTNWGKLKQYGGHIISWDAAQVAEAYAEGCRKIDSIKGAVA